MTRTLANGEVLDGSKHRYTLTFPAGDLPPASAFWSLTIYDGASQFLVENPINRYLINSPMLPSLKKNADGSLTVYIQKDPPGADKEANWLPAPDGPIYLVLRFVRPAGARAEQPVADTAPCDCRLIRLDGVHDMSCFAGQGGRHHGCRLRHRARAGAAAGRERRAPGPVRREREGPGRDPADRCPR